MRVVVLGGAGFIGSHLVDTLSAAGSEVLVIDDLSTGCMGNVSGHAEMRVASICDAGLYEIVRNWGAPDAAVILAAQTSVPRSYTQPTLDAGTNILGLINVVRTCVRMGIPHVVFSSSAAVYGQPTCLPVGESHPTDPQSPYAISKLAGEGYLRVLSATAGLVTCILRFSNVYGPRQRSDGEAGVAAIFADRFAHSRGVTVYGDGSQTRDFIYVEDVARAILRTLEKRADGVFNISTNSAVSVMGVFEIISEIVGIRVPMHHQPPRHGDIVNSRLDNRKAMEALDWEPSTGLRDGLRRTISWIKGD